MKFRNPTNDYVETGGTPLDCVGALLFGPIYYMIRGCWSQVGLHVLLFCFFVAMGPRYFVLFPICWLAQAINAPNEVNKRYRRMGWIEV
jgi:hypothetical protein